jgi:ankyrin repeat protein
VGELGNESGMTPLHLASFSGNENVVRLLLNSAGVQVDAATTENVYTLITYYITSEVKIFYVLDNICLRVGKF